MRRVLPILLCSLASCTTAPRPAPINHIVFVKLKNPADAQECIADCNARLGKISSVRAFHAGTHLNTGRDNIITDYDVALSIFFDDAAAYDAYVNDPLHTGLVEAWQPRLEWLRIYDVLDVSP